MPIPFDIMLDMMSGRAQSRSDYRSVPASDNGKAYTDQGALGGFSPSEQPYAPPADVKFMAGFGASEEDLRRGYCEPRLTDHPAYVLSNYKDRMSEPSVSDVMKGQTEAMPSDLEFRARNRQSKGFLVRSRIPRDRG